MCRGDHWQTVARLLPYRPYAALKFGYIFAKLRKYYEGQLIKPLPIMQAFDLARGVLFPYTDFHSASFDLFKKWTEGKLTFEEEQMLKAQGVQF
jgi:hypothetical protein